MAQEHAGQHLPGTKTVNSRAKNRILFSPTGLPHLLETGSSDYLFL
jgi:hypothetical protein